MFGKINRFDGSTTVTFTSDDGLFGNQMAAVMAEADGRVWVANGT